MDGASVPEAPVSEASVSRSSNRQIARAAGTVMVAFVFSSILGLVRWILFTRVFGADASLDAFNAANRPAETLFSLVAGGALASAFIPTFTAFLARDDRKGGWKLASAVFNLIFVIATFGAVLLWIFARPITHYLLAPGWTGPQEDLTVNLMRLMLPSAVIFAVSGLVMGILNSNQVFLIPALTPSMYSLGIIFGVVVLSPHMSIYGPAWGVLIGASLHLGLQIPALLKQKISYFPTFGLKTPAVREVARLMGPRLLGVAVVQLNFWINTSLASSMTEGSVTAISLAFMLMLMPQAAIAQSIAIAAMPTFSAQVALGKLDEMRHSLAASLRGVLMLSIPAALGLMLLRGPIVAVIFQHGAFDAHSTQLVSWALLWYGAGLVSHSVVEVLARAFYSLHDTATPVKVGIGAMSLNALFSVLLASLFQHVGWMPHGGLALANSLATTVEMILLFVLMRRRLQGIAGQQLLAGAAKILVSALLMTVGLSAWLFLPDSIPSWATALGGITFGAAIYLGAVFISGVSEARLLLRAITSRIRS